MHPSLICQGTYRGQTGLNDPRLPSLKSPNRDFPFQASRVQLVEDAAKLEGLSCPLYPQVFVQRR